jgi:acyl-CoA synthetase (AMP-forming)/AMP-acid ligase II
LREKIFAAASGLAPETRGLVLCCAPRSLEGATAYLAAAQAGHAIILADPAAPNLSSIAASYRPEWIVAPKALSFDGYEATPWPPESLGLFRRKDKSEGALHSDFYLLLLTSGSTGSGKGVRLSYRNVASNTRAIIESLGQTNVITALCHLPISYSFGLSILQTQLAVGGRCLLTEESMMSGAFWNLAREQEATLFAGVPYHYEMLLRLGLARLKLPALKIFLQAGGKMQIPLTQKMLEEVQKRQGELFIMYGQTEASPRISSFPLHKRPEKIGSSGVALSGGKLEIVDGEIVYTGPNVMMGPAETREDLAKGDVMNGKLVTGDLGELDGESFLTITATQAAFRQAFGQRVALDDLEKIARAVGLHGRGGASEKPFF